MNITSAATSESDGFVEQWRPIPGSHGLYSVSSLGRVRSEPVQTSQRGRKRGRILRCNRDSKGYLQFAMSLLEGRRQNMKVHRAVALAFLGPRPPGAQVNHRSGDKTDNTVGNLEYVSCRQNIRHGWSNGLYSAEHARGEKNPVAKLTSDAVRRIRELGTTASLAGLAARFGVTKQNIWLILKGRTWRHVA